MTQQQHRGVRRQHPALELRFPVRVGRNASCDPGAGCDLLLQSSRLRHLLGVVRTTVATGVMTGDDDGQPKGSRGAGACSIATFPPSNRKAPMWFTVFMAWTYRGGGGGSMGTPPISPRTLDGMIYRRLLAGASEIYITVKPQR